LLDINDLAARWRTTPGAIHALRYRGVGPRAFRAGRKLMWRLDDVLAWEDAQAAEPPKAAYVHPLRAVR
jgi:hypothetical protein